MIDRIMAKVTPEPNSGCWLWLGSVNNRGYAVIWAGTNQTSLAHRLVYEALIGPLLPGLVIDHLCRVRCCVNPAHLAQVTSGENSRRGQWPNSAKTHCPKGHPYEGANLFINNRGRRECRTCKRARNRRHG